MLKPSARIPIRVDSGNDGIGSGLGPARAGPSGRRYADLSGQLDMRAVLISGGLSIVGIAAIIGLKLSLWLLLAVPVIAGLAAGIISENTGLEFYDGGVGVGLGTFLALIGVVVGPLALGGSGLPLEGYYDAPVTVKVGAAVFLSGFAAPVFGIIGGVAANLAPR